MSPADDKAAGYHLLTEDDLDNVILSRCEWELELRLDQPRAKKETREGKTEKDYMTWDVTTQELSKYTFMKFTIKKVW